MNDYGLTGRSRSTHDSKRSAFTLIELLVVIAIIGILASLLLPSLSRSKSHARSLACLNNLKQLQVCWHLYATDNEDTLPPNNSLYSISTHSAVLQGGSWCTNLAPYHTDPESIQSGALYPFNQSIGIYHCPADQSTIEDPSTHVKTSLPRLRSYNMSLSVNGWPEFNWDQNQNLPSFKKLSGITTPTPSMLFTFIDVHEDSIFDSLFGIPTRQSFPNANAWWDIPANRHDQGCNFSFADSHVEHWKWKVPKTVKVAMSVQSVPAEERPDYERVQAAIRQTWDGAR